MEKIFELGKIQVHGRAFELIDESKDFSDFVGLCLTRYKMRDWGDSDEASWKANDDAVENGGKVIANYVIPEDIDEPVEHWLWIETEADRSCTTIQFIEI